MRTKEPSVDSPEITSYFDTLNFINNKCNLYSFVNYSGIFDHLTEATEFCLTCKMNHK